MQYIKKALSHRHVLFGLKGFVETVQYPINPFEVYKVGNEENNKEYFAKLQELVEIYSTYCDMYDKSQLYLHSQKVQYTITIFKMNCGIYLRDWATSAICSPVFGKKLFEATYFDYANENNIGSASKKIREKYPNLNPNDINLVSKVGNVMKIFDRVDVKNNDADDEGISFVLARHIHNKNSYCKYVGRKPEVVDLLYKKVYEVSYTANCIHFDEYIDCEFPKCRGDFFEFEDDMQLYDSLKRITKEIGGNVELDTFCDIETNTKNTYYVDIIHTPHNDEYYVRNTTNQVKYLLDNEKLIFSAIYSSKKTIVEFLDNSEEICDMRTYGGSGYYYYTNKNRFMEIVKIFLRKCELS